MKTRAKTALLLTILSAAAMVALISGCGGGSSTTTPSSSSPATGEGNSGPFGGGGPSSFMEPKNPNNKYAKFGKEASSADREAASAVLAENLKAREIGDFATQCGTLSAAGVKEIAGATDLQKAKEKCPQALKELAEPLQSTEGVRTDTLRGQIDVFRVKGKKGFALYHGKNGKDWMMPMTQEGGLWKVTSIVTTEVG